MRYEILPCTEEESDYIDEQSDQFICDSASLDVEYNEEEFIYEVTDREGQLLGGCVLVTNELKTGTVYCLWVEEVHRRQGIASALMREAERKAKERGC